MLLENKNAVIYGAGGAIGGAQVGEEHAVVARFVARVNALGPLSQASPALQARLLEEVKIVARRIDGSAEAGAASGYDRRVLHDDPANWSLAAISLRPGQQTHPHDHGGWGCAVTVQGVERDRRFVYDASGNLVLSDERDYPPGTGYVFDAVDVHQPVGADPRRVTVALHFLVHESHPDDGLRHRHAVMLRHVRASSESERQPDLEPDGAITGSSGVEKVLDPAARATKRVIAGRGPEGRYPGGLEEHVSAPGER